jgi:murein DD-endopeptidase MepM/ murein hydrolase activator NlpD
MTILTFNLPKHRLDVSFVKRRGGSIGEPLLPNLRQIRKIRSGNKVSRFFRHVFEHKNIRKIMGTNLALMIIASTLIPTDVFANVEAENPVIAETQSPLTTEHSVQYPLREVKITQGYKLFHPGIDFDGITGDEVRPIKPGRVEAVSTSKYAYGNAVIVNHGNNITSLYAHLSKILVFQEQEVTTNTVIGLVGTSGYAIGDHLHLEIRDHGIAVNPYTVLPR